MPESTGLIRSLKSFGISGVLGVDAEVFYSTFFSTRHLGKVSDLLASRLDKEVDELRLRALITFTVFHACRGQVQNGKSSGLKNSENPEFGDPLVLECGTDHKTIAIGISFVLHNEIQFALEGILERLKERKPLNTFEKFLLDYQTHSDQLILKFCPSIRKVEVISLLNLKRNLGEPLVYSELEIVTINENEVEHAPLPKLYANLGDIDYESLLDRQDTDKYLSNATTGTLFEPDGLTQVLGLPIQAPEEKKRGLFQRLKDVWQRVRGWRDEDQESIVKGHAHTADNQDTVVGAFEAHDAEAEVGRGDTFIDELVRIKGERRKASAKTRRSSEGAVQSEDESAEEGESNEISEDQDQSPSTIGELVEKASRQVRKLLGIDPSSQPADSEDAGPDPHEATEENAEKKKAKVKQKGNETPAVDVEVEGEELENEIEESQEKRKKKGKSDKSESSEVLDEDIESYRGRVQEPETESGNLVRALKDGKLQQVIKKVQEELLQIKPTLSPPSAGSWMDSMVGKLAHERDDLVKMSKNVNASVRLKELEYRKEIGELEDELSRRESQLLMKNRMITRNKEQIAEAAQTVEKLREELKAATANNLYKQKFEAVQSLLAHVKEENRKLTMKSEELRNELNAAAKQANVKTREQTASVSETTVLKEKCELMAKQIEEYKKANRQLLEVAGKAAQNKPVNTGETAELKRRLEAAMKLTAVSRKEVDDLRKRLDQSQQQEAALKADLFRSQAELSRMQSITVAAVQKKKAGSGSSSG